MQEEKVFTRAVLAQYDGEGHNRMYIAFQGLVYDVTDCPKWRLGLHEGLHWPGQDLTSEIGEAPHTAEVFTRPSVKQVGRLEA